MELSTHQQTKKRKQPEEKREEKYGITQKKPMHKEVSTQNRRGGC
jgi:hypothetical protein